MVPVFAQQYACLSGLNVLDRSKFRRMLNLLDVAACRRMVTIWFGASIDRILETVLGVHYEWMYWKDERGFPPYGHLTSSPQNVCLRGAQSDHSQPYITTALCRHNPQVDGASCHCPLPCHTLLKSFFYQVRLSEPRSHLQWNSDIFVSGYHSVPQHQYTGPWVFILDSNVSN